jgi:predicted Zn-dependent peptidase
VDLTEPPSRKEIRYRYQDPFAPFPALSLSYKVPERTHRDFAVFEILEKILCDGESSRLYASLIESQETALHVIGGNDGKFGPGLFFIFAQLHPRKQLEDLEKSILGIVDDILENGVSEDELNKAKNKIKADYISHQETTRSLADLFCMYATLYGDPNRFFRELEEFEEITVDRVQEVARKYFIPENRSVIEVYPPEKPQS